MCTVFSKIDRFLFNGQFFLDLNMIRKSYLDITLSDSEGINSSESHDSISFLNISVSGLDDTVDNISKIETIPIDIVFESEIEAGT